MRSRERDSGPSVTRRAALKAGVGAGAATAGLLCSDAAVAQEANETEGGNESEGSDETGGSNESEGEGATDEDGQAEDEGVDWGDWFEDVENFEGTEDLRGEETVLVEVGAGDGLRFAPPAIRVDPGTTVQWEWTGEGGAHNVVHTDEAFRSEIVSEAGHTFEHRFDEEGLFTYVCEPHLDFGMKGGVAVGDDPGAQGQASEGSDAQARQADDGETGDQGEDGGADGEGQDGEGQQADQEGATQAQQGEEDEPRTDDGDSAVPLLGVVGAALVLAFLSPLVFALVLYYAYDERRAGEYGRQE